jgi:hypothetical protein
VDESMTLKNDLKVKQTKIVESSFISMEGAICLGSETNQSDNIDEFKSCFDECFINCRIDEKQMEDFDVTLHRGL